jgi:hypothetical protein
MIYKFSNTELSINSASSVYDNPIVRLVNPSTAEIVVTLSVNSTVNVASFTILANSEMVVEKTNTYRVQANGVLASPVAYRG